jgi:hypothetical protein
MGAKKTSKKKKAKNTKSLTFAEWIKEKLEPIEPKPRMSSGNKNARKVLKKTEH